MVCFAADIQHFVYGLLRSVRSQCLVSLKQKVIKNIPKLVVTKSEIKQGFIQEMHLKDGDS